MTDATAAAGALERQGSPRPDEGGWSWTASLFLAPAILLLAVFLLYPTISTIILSFENGIDNYVRLFTRDPNFLNLRSFPPSGAFWNNILWVVFYTAGCVLFGLVIARHGSAGALRGAGQGDRLPAPGHRRHRPRRHLALRLLPEPARSAR